MNFKKMPFLDWENGWLVAMGLIVALAAGTYFLCKRIK
jgi:LPXTG-motif cell wall-anchored protein